jgi:hypothetical protein
LVCFCFCFAPFFFLNYAKEINVCFLLPCYLWSWSLCSSRDVEEEEEKKPEFAAAKKTLLSFSLFFLLHRSSPAASLLHLRSNKLKEEIAFFVKKIGSGKE